MVEHVLVLGSCLVLSKLTCETPSPLKMWLLKASNLPGGAIVEGSRKFVLEPSRKKLITKRVSSETVSCPRSFCVSLFLPSTMKRIQPLPYVSATKTLFLFPCSVGILP